jgi:hypothetical protein
LVQRAGGPPMRMFSVVIFLLLLPVSGAFSQQTQPIMPAARVVPADAAPVKPRDPNKLPENAQLVYYSALRAAEWLKLANKPDGRFVYGFQPSLRVQLDGDNFASQAGATFALARAARYFRDARGNALATQACLSLLLETMLDPKDATIRHTAAAPHIVNRPRAHGLLISAIHELASPPKDLLDDAEHLCNYFKDRQKPDGAFADNAAKDAFDEIDGENAGWALQGIIRSHKHRPASWKLDALAKARAHYFTRWQANKSLRIACSHTPAYAEAFALTKDKAYADAVFAMNDWLLGLQYREEFDSQRKQWIGGFPAVKAGKMELTAPDIQSALAAESLADACRVARLAGDLPRLQRYERALLPCLHFVMSLQYTGKRVEHFVEAFRPSILGAFHSSAQDGNLRIDYTQHPLCAMVQYLDCVVE